MELFSHILRLCYHDVVGNSTQEIWKSLISAKKIDPDLGKALAVASQEIQALRCRMHLFNKESRQDIDNSKSEDEFKSIN